MNDRATKRGRPGVTFFSIYSVFKCCFKPAVYVSVVVFGLAKKSRREKCGSVFVVHHLISLHVKPLKKCLMF